MTPLAYQLRQIAARIEAGTATWQDSKALEAAARNLCRELAALKNREQLRVVRSTATPHLVSEAHWPDRDA